MLDVFLHDIIIYYQFLDALTWILQIDGARLPPLNLLLMNKKSNQ